MGSVLRMKVSADMTVFAESAGFGKRVSQPDAAPTTIQCERDSGFEFSMFGRDVERGLPSISRHCHEPLRVCRRLIDVSYAAMASVSRAASKLPWASAGGMFPIGLRRRRLLNQSTHSSVACSTASKLRQGPWRWMTFALNRPLIVSAWALS
jgi:hypothetical protein